MRLFERSRHIPGGGIRAPPDDEEQPRRRHALLIARVPAELGLRAYLSEVSRAVRTQGVEQRAGGERGLRGLKPWSEGKPRAARESQDERGREHVVRLLDLVVGVRPRRARLVAEAVKPHDVDPRRTSGDVAFDPSGEAWELPPVLHPRALDGGR